jgi:hypothetical protein
VRLRPSQAAAFAAACVAVLGLTACGPGPGTTGDHALPGQAPGAVAQADPSAEAPGTGTAPVQGQGTATASAAGSAQAAGTAGAGAAPAGAATGSSGAAGGTEARAVPPLSARLPDGRQTVEPRAATDPIGVSIPAIGVQARMVRLGFDAQREMEVPDDFSLAGWYVHGPRPGEVGPAVIAGHVDGRRGPAVFYRLHELTPGDRFEVHRADGSSVVYVVDRVEQHPKDAFPTEAVYGNTAGPELRLITCGGEFDRRARSHRDNIIVFAHMEEG